MRFSIKKLNINRKKEQLLPIGGVCLLGSLNLTQFIDIENGDWDYKKLEKYIPIAVRFMDNVNDVTNVPLQEQRDNLINKRRIGLGIMGYGSALMMMKVRYGSQKALELTDKLMNFIMNTGYKASSDIAAEKGSFKLYDEEKYLAGNFVSKLEPDTIERIRKNGMRNSHVFSIQPTGNTGILANVVSGGLEPIFMPEYMRTSIMPYAPEGLDVPKNVDWSNKSYESSTEWAWIKEGDENLLRTNFNGYNWKFDKSRGLLRETIVKDYAVRFLEARGEWDPTADWAATTTELSIDEHVDSMKIISNYIDSAISKTTNIPNEYPYEDFKDLYMKLYKTGTVKGGTTYRAGTMTEVLGSVDKKEEEVNENKISKTNAPKRPKSLGCDIYHVTAAKQKWVVIVGKLEEDPYEIFAFKPKSIHLPTSVTEGYLVKVKKGVYNLECSNGLVIDNIAEHFETDEQEALTRMISTSLRHGADVQFVVEQLNKSEGTIVSFAKAIGRTLKRYIKDGIESKEACENCGEQALVFQEGCFVCTQCGSSKCS